MKLNYFKVVNDLHSRLTKIATLNSFTIYKFVIRVNKLTFIALDAVIRIETDDLDIERKVAAICGEVSKTTSVVIFPVLMVRKCGCNKEEFRPIRNLTNLVDKK